MKAAFFDEFAGPLRIDDVPDPQPSRDGVVVRVEATGVCRSDWHGWMGHDPDIRLPHVPGHEFAGVIEETGAEVRRWRKGDRVTVPFAVGCGRCPQCLAGCAHICDNHFQPGFTAWGSFASHVAIPYADHNVIRLPDELGFVEAASLGCRFATAFRAVVAQGAATPGAWVAVHGCGGVGLSAVMIAHAIGARVIGVDINAAALRLATEIGADAVIDAATVEDVIGAIHERTEGGADVSIDALGSRTTCLNSVGCLGKGGRHVQVGLMVGDDSAPPIPMARVISHELRLIGSHGLPAHAYTPMLDMICSGRLEPTRLVDRTVGLQEGITALQSMASNEASGVTVIDRLV